MALGEGQVISWYICTVVAVLFLAFRLVVRWRKFQALFVEDYLIVFAAGCLVGDLGIQQHMWNLGMANIETASRENFVGIMQMIVPGSILYVTALWAIKISLVLFYKRLVDKTKLEKIYNITLGLLVATWLVIFFNIIFYCWPIDRKWTTDPTRKCSMKASNINYWLTILLNIFSDVIIISLPISIVLKLQMPLKQRLGIAAIFAMGFSVVVSSIVRAYYAKRNETMLTCTESMIEEAVAIIATCLPVLGPFFLGYNSQAGTSSGGQHYTSSASRHYELSSNRTSKSLHNNHTMNTYVVGGTRKASDSEDDLFQDEPSHPSSVSNMPIASNTAGITLTTEYEISEEKRRGSRNTKGLDV